MLDKTSKILIAILCVSLLANAFLVFMCAKTYFVLTENTKAKEIKYNVLSFTNMFVEGVLLAEGEVDFDTRLSLETAVRNLNDEQIFAQWQRFTKSSDESTSVEVKKLLDLLIKKSLEN